MAVKLTSCEEWRGRREKRERERAQGVPRGRDMMLDELKCCFAPCAACNGVLADTGRMEEWIDAVVRSSEGRIRHGRSRLWPSVEVMTLISCYLVKPSAEHKERCEPSSIISVIPTAPRTQFPVISKRPSSCVCLSSREDKPTFANTDAQQCATSRTTRTTSSASPGF